MSLGRAISKPIHLLTLISIQGIQIVRVREDTLLVCRKTGEDQNPDKFAHLLVLKLQARHIIHGDFLTAQGSNVVANVE